ncbi:MAG TPA: DUF5682 family protein [Chitinophagaceae bacterium]|nr:DUF5682 family protein [Chitinophagaceae bacterium]
MHILGIRHHGPGSSKHLLKALVELQPDIVLIEGPPEGEAILKWVSDENMKAPVAMLAYVPDNPKQAVFYPFAEYSPEWNAMKYAQKKNIPIRFIDMPLAHKFGLESKVNEQEMNENEDKILSANENRIIKRNPIAYLAEIAGYEDAEEWWEQQFELAQQPQDVFEAIANSMTVLRQHVDPNATQEEVIREAFMRKAIRTAQKEMYSTIVVICGAWHVPALQNMPSQKDDDAVLKSLPKSKIETTWIPWTNDRLSFESGYGAGINSPGWYSHCWKKTDINGIEWLTHTARVFRKHKIEISSSHIIESVRLANSLSQLRNFSKPGLKEMNEATQTVMCMGDEILMQIVWKDLIVGSEMGSIPEGTPQVPLVYSFEKLCKTLRLKLSAEDKLISLDLREENDLQKSILLHRLNTMNIPWGEIKTSNSKGTFKEEWLISWTPELYIALIEKAPWGNTIELACNQFVINETKYCKRLSEISSLVQKALPAELHDGISFLMKRMDELSASTNDTVELIDTMIPLVQISRYGNVRKTDLETVNFILHTVFYRMIVGLPMSTIGIDDDQTNFLAGKLNEVQQAILILNIDDLKQSWLNTILTISTNEHVSAMIQGLGHKILYDTQFVESNFTQIAFSRALSIQQDPNFAVNWLEGFLKDAGNLLILDEIIWNIVYDWVASISQDNFQELVPLLRRTFSAFNSVEKIKLAEKVKHGKSQIGNTNIDLGLHEERAQRVIPIIEKLLHI